MHLSQCLVNSVVNKYQYLYTRLFTFNFSSSSSSEGIPQDDSWTTEREKCYKKIAFLCKGDLRKSKQYLQSYNLIALVAQSCLTLCDALDCSPPLSSVHRILQARILEWVAVSFSNTLINFVQIDILIMLLESFEWHLSLSLYTHTHTHTHTHIQNRENIDQPQEN